MCRLSFSGNVKHVEISLQVCACEWCFRRPCCLLRQMRHSRGCCRKPLSCCGLPLPLASCAWPWAGLPGFFVVKRATNVVYLPLLRASPRCITAFIARPNGPFGVVAGAVWRRCACVFAIPHALFRLPAPGTRRAEMLNFRTISLQYAAPPLLPCRSHCAAMVLPVGFFCVLLPPWT